MEEVNFEDFKQRLFIAGTYTSSKVPTVEGETRDFLLESCDKGEQGDRKNERPSPSVC